MAAFLRKLLLMRYSILILLAGMLLMNACGPSVEEQRRLSRMERQRLAREDSAAFKIAVMPTADCLPLYVARMHDLYKQLGADVRLKGFTAQMDCDTALTGGSVQAGVTDLVRAQRLMSRGTALDYLTATNAQWQLVANRMARVREIKQLKDKLTAMTRYSATDLFTDYALDSVKLKEGEVFKIQVNDVGVRLNMLLGNEMDAEMLTEPQAAAARLARHNVLMDTRHLGLCLGALVVRRNDLKDAARRKQLEVVRKAWNMACDSINKYGMKRYGQLLAEYAHVSQEAVMKLDGKLTYRHIARPRQKDIDMAARWLKRQ